MTTDGEFLCAGHYTEVLHLFILFSLQNNPGKYDQSKYQDNPSFTGERTEPQRGEVTCWDHTARRWHCSRGGQTLDRHATLRASVVLLIYCHLHSPPSAGRVGLGSSILDSAETGGIPALSVQEPLSCMLGVQGEPGGPHTAPVVSLEVHNSSPTKGYIPKGRGP